MKLLERSQLPIYMNESTYCLEFQAGLTCASCGSRTAGDMLGLFRNLSDIDHSVKCYDFYRDVVFDKDRMLFQKYDLRYDITVIAPGVINGECKKTSGHYHGYIKNDTCVYPEIYEVLEGNALYILQKVSNFDREEEPLIEDRKAVFVQAGQAIIIPPFYGHCSINVGDGPMAFCNIAVVSCPLYYDTIKAKRGLSFYALKDENGHVRLENNENYINVESDIVKAYPVENLSLGIRFNHPVYHEFINTPEKFEYLNKPANYIESIHNMYKENNQ